MTNNQGNDRRLTLFRVSLVLCSGIAIWGIWLPDSLATTAQLATRRVFSSLDWFFMLSVTTFLVLSIGLAFSRFGRLRLGGEDDRPEFSTASWLAMLFSAGMGTGVLFWGVAEPMIHFSSPPLGDAATADAARRAVVITNFHWGLHAWAVYAMAALVLAYFGFRKGRRYLAGAPIRAGYTGRWVEPVAKGADLIAVVAVVFGVSGSIVMGTMQLQTGLNATLGVPLDSTAIRLGIIGALVVAYMASAATSLDKGIKWLSNINVTLALALMIFVLTAGPTAKLMRGFVTAAGDYVAALPSMTLQLYPYRDLGGWMESWTLTYFVWWIAWAPFVGVFIARISRGRTIREFLIGVVFTPTLLSVLWFAVFGGVALHHETVGGADVSRLIAEDVSTALFAVLELLPMGQILSGISVLLISIFLITSADSATYVLGMLTSRGSLEPPTHRKLAWGLGLGAISVGLMLSGTMDAIRAVTVIGAIPFTFVMLIQIGALLRTLPSDMPPGAPDAVPHDSTTEVSS